MNTPTNPPAEPESGSLHITLHLVNGRTQRFVQTEPALIQRIMTQARPDRAFVQKHLVFDAPDTATVLPTESIERLDLRSDPLPEWPFGERAFLVAEMEEEEYRQMLRREPPLPAKFVGRVVPSRPTDFGVAAQMRSGAETYFRMSLQPPAEESAAEPPERTGDDARQFLIHAFTRPVIFGRMREGNGVFLLNPANVLSLVVTPSPPDAMPGSWPVTAEG